MKTMVLVSGFSLFAMVSALACGSSSSGGATGSPGAGGSNGAGAGTGAGGTGMGTGGCNNMAMGGNTASTPACDTYATCIQGACDSEYKAALGPDYKTGMFSGPCKDYFDCTTACGCDKTCSSNCSSKLTSNMACTSAFQALGVCAQSHCMTEEAACSASEPKGTGGSSSGTGGSGPGAGGSGGTMYTCADLTACCNDPMFPASAKDSCLMAATSQPTACNLAVSSYKMAHLCNLSRARDVLMGLPDPSGRSSA